MSQNKERNYSKNRETGRSKKTRTKNETNKSKVEEVSKHRPYNDASWYASSPELLRDSASISYNNALGVKVDLNSKAYGQESYRSESRDSLPGVMSISLYTLPGISEDNSSPVNIAARNIYSFVRHQNSGHANYDSPDLMNYLLAMDEIYSFYNYCKRLYGVMQQYSVMNRYMPRAIVEAMNVDFDGVLADIPTLRYYINSLANKINTLCVPATMSYMIRHSWLYSNVYLDSDDPKAQAYVFTPAGYRVFNEMSEPAKLEYRDWTRIDSVADIIAIGDEMIAAVIESEDMNIMSGDILKAYGNNLFRVAPIDENYSVIPVYNEEVLSQIENTTIIGARPANPDITVNMDTNAIIVDPTMEATWTYGFNLKRIINMHKSTVEPSDTMVATRLMVPTGNERPDPDSTVGGVFFDIDACGTEIALNANIIYFGYTSGAWTLKSRGINSFPSLHANSAAQFTDNILMMSKFNRHPIQYVMQTTQPTGQVYNAQQRYFLGLNWDVDNYTVIDNATLLKMHDTAVLSEFGIGK